MDALADVLRVSHLTSCVFLQAEFTAPWCVEAKCAPENCAPVMGETPQLIAYHYVVEGELRARPVGGNEEFCVRTGGLLLLPRNDIHRLGSDLSLPPVPGTDILQRPANGSLFTIQHGGGGARTRVISGFLGCGNAKGNPVLAALPPMLAINIEDAGSAEWIRSTVHYAAAEVAAGKPGSENVLEKLSELLFVEAVRRHAESMPDAQAGWLAGLRDPYVARALALLHRDVARPWTVETLSNEVGLSRSALAERFSNLIGEAPMHYLAGWRMQIAAQKLQQSNVPLAKVASLVGYESEAAFSRAFKKAFGTAPATWRRKAAAPIAAE